MSNVTQTPFTDPQSQPQLQGTSSNKGCLWGCLIAVGVVVAMCLCAGGGAYWMYTSTLTAYTSETPMELSTVEYDDDELAELKAKLKSFREDLDADKTPEEDLILSAEDINALIAADENLRGRVFVEIDGEQVKGDVSIPLDKIPGGKGRYLNGSGTFDVSMDNGFLIVTADQMEVNGEPVPDAFMQGMRQENLAKEVYKNPENAKFIRKFEDIRIEDEKFYLRVKRDTDENASPTTAPEKPTPPSPAVPPEAVPPTASPTEASPLQTSSPSGE